MLFLLKRTWYGGLCGLVVLALLGFGARQLVPSPLALELSLEDVRWGVFAVALVLVSDGLIHGLLVLLLGERYRRKHTELARLFLGQSFPAIVMGALMAGIGEELCFRSLDGGAGYLFFSAVIFGLLHHIRGSLWPFTVWSVWQGFLFAGVMLHFQRLGVTMTAHFLHDFLGFLGFRYFYNRGAPLPP